MASKSCLFANEPLDLEVIGLVDGVNYVKIDENNIEDKLRYYLAHKDERCVITENGYKLVFEKYSCNAQANFMFSQMSRHVRNNKNGVNKMIRVALYEDDFYEMYHQNKRKIIAYGAGNGLKQNFDKLTGIDLVCDINAKEIGEFRGIKVIEPGELQDLNEPLYIIVFICDGITYTEVCNALQKYQIDAVIFHYFNNISFGHSFWDTAKAYQVAENSRKLSVNLVCQDGAWIFKKFADRMCECLSGYGVDTVISSNTHALVDINHHIPYVAYEPYPNDTLMITHVDNMKKIMLLKKQLKTASMGVCMSNDTMNRLVSYGIPRNKLCYINPAQDNVIKPHKYVIGITHKCHDAEDLRKRATALLDVLETVDPLYFKFSIMGAGWDKIIAKMKEKGFEVEYYPEFDYDKYNTLMQKIDYFLYMGFDEGTMGYLDALAAGAGTIVTPQGYHLDTDCQIDYPCSTVSQFRAAFLDLQRKREIRRQAVSNWTWENYVLKHLEIWEYILKRKDLKELYKNQSCYNDGIFSVMVEDNRV